MMWWVLGGVIVVIAGVLLGAYWLMVAVKPAVERPVIDADTRLAIEALGRRAMVHVHELAGTIGERNIWMYDELESSARYITGVWREQGMEALLSCFDAPPASTEQILHPLKREDTPVAVELPDSPPRLGGRTEVVHDDVLGELALRDGHVVPHVCVSHRDARSHVLHPCVVRRAWGDELRLPRGSGSLPRAPVPGVAELAHSLDRAPQASAVRG